MTDEKTVQDIKQEIDQLANSIIGKINGFDSKKDVGDTALGVLNSIIAKVDLSKLEKAGIISYLQAKRVQ